MVASLLSLCHQMEGLRENVDDLIQSWQNKLQRNEKQPYSIISSWIKRNIIFSLLQSIGLCLRGSRSIRENKNILKSIENYAVVSEGITKLAF